MRYMLMSHVDGTALKALPPDTFAEVSASFVAFTTALAESGVLRGAEHLHPVDTATTVRVRDDETLLTDGPHADVTEAFGGFWIVEVPDLDTALKHAVDCPAARFGAVEVRSLIEMGR
jgi:hypothetical protein